MKKALIVDDNEQNLYLLQTMLNERPFDKFWQVQAASQNLQGRTKLLQDIEAVTNGYGFLMSRLRVVSSNFRRSFR